MQDYHQMFRIEIVNSVDKQVLTDEGDFYPVNDGIFHYGVMTSRQIVEKYHGYLTFLQNEADLTAVVLIPLPNE